MKRIIKCIIFIAIFLIILEILSKIFIPKNNTLEAGLGKRKLTASGIYTEPENTIDVLVLGDSESYTSYIPLELWNQYGFTSYVCGTPAQRLSVSLSYIKDALKTQKPKIVLLENIPELGELRIKGLSANGRRIEMSNNYVTERIKDGNIIYVDSDIKVYVAESSIGNNMSNAM